ncbi:MAG TPA: tetratricopeptide repeat protein [Planctomycetaceae bacterium]|nr:tetratricopeptide repeat protein [Planctomycetaceae bacterium]
MKVPVTLAAAAILWASALGPASAQEDQPGQQPAEGAGDAQQAGVGQGGRGGDAHTDVFIAPPWDPHPWPHHWAYPYWPYYYPGSVYYAPLIIPPEWLYGPQAIRRFMGWDYYRAPVVPNIVVLGKDAKGGADAQQRGQLRGTGERSVALGWKFIGYGDKHFARQRYREAYQRYKSATGVAPRLGAAWLRQTFALIAMGRYELAAKALKRGLELDPNWPRSGFRVDHLYGENKLAKAAHLNALADAATQEPHNGDLLLLVGLFLFSDGQQQRASLFLKRAAELAGEGRSAFEPLLDAAQPPAL